MQLRCLSVASFLSLAFVTASHSAEVFRTTAPQGSLYQPFPAVWSMEQSPRGAEVDFSAWRHLRVEGRIDAGDAEKLSALLEEALPDFNQDMFNDVVVSFNSDGGDFYTGLEMADVLSRFAVATYVGPGDRCLSSCAIAFLGGQQVALRGFPQVPNRYVHAEGIVGFHAPFSALSNALQIPEGTPFSAALGNRLAQSFYGQAQAAINQLARRMEDWRLSPDFVFEMLNKSVQDPDERPLHERFLLINTYRRTIQTGTTLLAPELGYPSEIGMIDAYNACHFLLEANTNRSGQFFLPSETAAFANPDIIAEGLKVDGEFVPVETSGTPTPVVSEAPSGGASSEHLLPARGSDSFFFAGRMSGIGRVECNVFKDSHGQWQAKSFNPDIHSRDENDGDTLRPGMIVDRTGPYPVNRFTLSGPSNPWTAFGELEGVEHPHDGNEDELAALRAAFPDVDGPSFDCGGDLDPAALVICEFPLLGEQDGFLGALYHEARAAGGDQVRDAQRGWLSVRDRACRPAKIDLTDPILRRNLARCLLYFTTMRNRELLAQR